MNTATSTATTESPFTVGAKVGITRYTEFRRELVMFREAVIAKVHKNGNFTLVGDTGTIYTPESWHRDGTKYWTANVRGSRYNRLTVRPITEALITEVRAGKALRDRRNTLDEAKRTLANLQVTDANTAFIDALSALMAGHAIAAMNGDVTK